MPTLSQTDIENIEFGVIEAIEYYTFHLNLFIAETTSYRKGSYTERCLFEEMARDLYVELINKEFSEDYNEVNLSHPPLLYELMLSFLEPHETKIKNIAGVVTRYTLSSSLNTKIKSLLKLMDEAKNSKRVTEAKERKSCLSKDLFENAKDLRTARGGPLDKWEMKSKAEMEHDAKEQKRIEAEIEAEKARVLNSPTSLTRISKK